MFKPILLLLTVVFALGVQAQEEPAIDITGLWVVDIPRHTCLEGTLSYPAEKFVTRITKTAEFYKIRADYTYSKVTLNGNKITAEERPRYTVRDTWHPDGKTLSASIINEINRAGIILKLNGRLSEDGKIITGTDQNFCFRQNGYSLIDGPDKYRVRFTMTRANIAPAIVSIDSNDNVRKISNFSLRDQVHIAAFASNNWPDRTIEASSVVWTDGRKRENFGSLTLTRSQQDPTIYISDAITFRSAMVEDTAFGFRRIGDSLQLWGRPGSLLTAEVINGGTVDASLTSYFIMEVILETTTALLFFAMLAFLVERLTNGLCLIFGYLEFWRRHFETIPSANSAKNDRNYRNRRVFLFFLGIVTAVPLCVYFGFNIIDQLQLPAIDPVAEQIGTGLLAATGADPIREIVWGGDGVGGKFSIGRGGPKTIHVEAHLVAPPGSTIHVAEENKGETVHRQD